MKILRIMAIFFLMHGLLMSYEFIGEYLSGHNAVGWSVAEDDEDGYYVILTGECLDYGDYFCDSYDYGILRVGKYGEEIDYRVIYHYEYTRGKGKGRHRIKRGETGHSILSKGMRVRGRKDRSEDGCGRIVHGRDGSYYLGVCDVYYSDDFGWYSDVVAIKLDRDLNKEWSTEIGDMDYVSSMIEDSSGVIIGRGSGFGSGKIVKISRGGVVEWERGVGGYGLIDDGRGIVYSDVNEIGKMSYGGDSIWERKWIVDSGSFVILSGLNEGTGGGYIIAGSKEVNPDTFIGYIVKVDDSGRVEWQREYPGWFWVNGIFRDGDGYVVGWRPLGTAARITRIDSTGNIVWDRTYLDDVWTYYMYEIKPTSDGGYIMVGKSKFKQDLSIERVSVIKTDSMGLVDGVDWETDTPKVEMPERGMDYVVRSLYELRDLIFRDRLIKIYTVTGQEIRSRDLSELNRGMYLYRRSGGKEGKLLIIRK